VLVFRSDLPTLCRREREVRKKIVRYWAGQIVVAYGQAGLAMPVEDPAATVRRDAIRKLY
jgi:hypothetical protein